MPTAHIIIDDPLLRERYGFLDYSQLFDSLESLNYGLTIAFIPWNYRRTKQKAAELFLNHGSKLSICVHGCDHTKNEFGVTDQSLLEQKALLALNRMGHHQQRTNLPFGKVMVFPQGRFSKAAISALRRNHYLAAVNTTKFPIDSGEAELTIADELMPAASRFSGFPIFHRRYPKDLAHFAVDLFLGKPAYVVEHHDVFRHGCSVIETCVHTLKKMEPRLSWSSLAAASERLHLRKECQRGYLDVRFFTSTFVFENPSNRTVTCRFYKPETDPSIVRNVRLNGLNFEFQTGDQFIAFQLEMKPQESICVQIEDRDDAPVAVFIPRTSYALKTRVRRHLSEFRDNCLARHPSLLKPAKFLMHLIKATSEAKTADASD